LSVGTVGPIGLAGAAGPDAVVPDFSAYSLLVSALSFFASTSFSATGAPSVGVGNSLVNTSRSTFTPG